MTRLALLKQSCPRTLLFGPVLMAALTFSTLPALSQANTPVRSSQKRTASKPPTRQVLALFDAAEKGDTSRVKALLDKGVSAKAQAPNGLTPLILASMMNHPATAKLLIERGVTGTGQRRI